MDQSSLGKPRTLDSEVVIEIEEEGVEEINVGVEPDVEEPEGDAASLQTGQDEDDANVDAILADDNLMEVDETNDECGEREDFAEEYLSISNDVAQEPPAICLNTEEIERTFDELFGYVIFQRREILGDYLSPSALRRCKPRRMTTSLHLPEDSSFAPRSSTRSRSCLGHRQRMSTCGGHLVMGEGHTKQPGMT